MAVCHRQPVAGRHRRTAADRAAKPLMAKKKGPEPKLGAFSPDGYSGGKGGAARLSYSSRQPSAPGLVPARFAEICKIFAGVGYDARTTLEPAQLASRKRTAASRSTETSCDTPRSAMVTP